MANREKARWGFVLDPHYEAGNAIIRDGAKWFLDFLRNILIVGGLFVLAEKSGNRYLEILSWVAGGVLFIYLSSYWTALGFRFPRSLPIWVKLLLTALGIVIVGAITLIALNGLHTAINEIVRAQRS